MITPILEKLLLTGKAKNKIHHFSFASFTRINVPADSYIVIHRIFYTPFLNQEKIKITDLTWKDFFRLCQYQLKIKSDKDSPIYYIFNNTVDFQLLVPAFGSAFTLDTPIDEDLYNKFVLMQPQQPLIFDCFMTSFDYLNFTLTRNSAVKIGVPPPAFQPVNQYANEIPPPEGIQGVNVLLEGIFTGNATTDYQPPTNKISGQALPTNEVESYKQHIDGSDAFGNNWSMINNPDDATGNKLDKSEFVTNPLISFEYCVIQKNTAGKDLSSL